MVVVVAIQVKTCNHNIYSAFLCAKYYFIFLLQKPYEVCAIMSHFRIEETEVLGGK